MREAEITCTCKQLRLNDLNLSLMQGDQVRLPEAVARRSVDLERYRQLGGVQVRYVETARQMRPAPRPPKVLARPTAGTPVPTVPGPPPQGAAEPPLEEVVRVVVQEELERFRAQVLSELRQMLLEFQRAPASSAAPAVPATPRGTVSEDAPVFIPARIGGADAVRAEIAPKTESSTSEGVDGAAEALRVARRGRKRT